MKDKIDWEMTMRQWIKWFFMGSNLAVKRKWDMKGGVNMSNNNTVYCPKCEKFYNVDVAVCNHCKDCGKVYIIDFDLELVQCTCTMDAIIDFKAEDKGDNKPDLQLTPTARRSKND